MFAKAATTLFLVSPLASTSKKSQKVYRIVGLNSPTYPHFSWYLGSHGNPVHTGIRGPCWRSQTSCSMSLLAQDLVLARNIHYRGDDSLLHVYSALNKWITFSRNFYYLGIFLRNFLFFEKKLKTRIATIL